MNKRHDGTAKAMIKWEGHCGDTRLKKLQKITRPHGWTIFSEKMSGSSTLKRLTFWTYLDTPFAYVEESLKLNKLWPVVKDGGRRV